MLYILLWSLLGGLDSSVLQEVVTCLVKDIGAIKTYQELDLIINIETWQDGMSYDRLGLETQYTTLMGVKIPTVTIPVKPGRNLAVIIEVAAMNNRQKKLGYNTAQEFTERINKHFAQSMLNGGGND